MSFVTSGFKGHYPSALISAGELESGLGPGQQDSDWDNTDSTAAPALTCSLVTQSVSPSSRLISLPMGKVTQILIQCESGLICKKHELLRWK